MGINTVRYVSRILARGSRLLARGSRWFDKISKRSPVNRAAALRYPAKLNVGCGYDKREGYLNVDVDPVCSPDLLIVDGDNSAIPRRYFSEVLALDVIEHVPRPETLATLLDIADYLVDGGRLILKTTSIVHVAAKLHETTTYADHYGWTICLFGNQAHSGDFHYTGFTELTLRTHLIAAGFTIEELELNDDWMFYVEARKISDWTSLIESSRDFDNREFLNCAYTAALYRDPDEEGLRNCLKQLQLGISRKQVLHQLFSSPERLFRTAERKQAEVSLF